MIIDRLHERVREKGMVCVGLDSSLDYIPQEIKDKYQDTDQIIFQFNKRIIDATGDITAVYKPQIAFYEAYGLKGLMAYSRTLSYLRSEGHLSIGDIMRGDISSTAKMYGKAHFEGDFETDFITINPYMGFDSITPYLPYVESGRKGLFVLMRTSNPGARDIEYLEADGKKVYYHVGDRLAQMAEDFMGVCGYSSIAAVVGGTHVDEAVEIRERYGKLFFLIPGYGAQGARGEDVKLYLNENNGGVVNSSRGIITAYKKHGDGYENFDRYTREAVLGMREDIGFEG
jgi:orotidine-5'-phosphate decarboxylase